MAIPYQRVYLSQISPNYRRDLIWRPLLRLFRRWIKKEALSIDAYEHIRDSEITSQGRSFCEALELPEEMISQVRIQLAVLLMISSHRIVLRKRIVPGIAEMIEPYHSDIWPTYFKIFNETNQKFRRRFFQEPLIRELWARFLLVKEEQIVQYV